MICRRIILTLAACFLLSTFAAAGQELSLIHSFNEVVLPITDLSLGLEARFATGFCLDPACRFIGTNYHVAKMVRLNKIAGQKIINQYLDTGPDDDEAALNEMPNQTVDLVPVPQRSLKFTVSRDLAIFELRHSLPHHHGISFSLHDLQEGQQIDIYTYPKGFINPIRKLRQFHGTFKGETATGLLAFDYTLNGDKAIRPGASGGIVVDRESQQIVGILNGIAKGGETIALAVPIAALVEFVTKVEPYLAQNIFPSAQGISPTSADLYPKYVPSPADRLERRTEEPPQVTELRKRAQALADSMRNFIAVQTVAWGSGLKEPAAQAAYEIRMIDGSERLRHYPDGKKELRDMPFPHLNSPIVPGSEWSDLPEMVGTELRLRVHQAADAVVNEHRMRVFQYDASVEDAVCKFATVSDFGFFEVHRNYTVACYGEVWTDEDTNIARMSVHYEFPGKFGEYRAVVTYGWLKRADEGSLLIPLALSSEFERKNRIDWCRSQFTNYQVFSAHVRILANEPAPDSPGS